MKFDDLDKKMRVFEIAHDYCVLPEMYMVARIDGKGFTRLTKEIYKFEAPFDVKFRDYMVETTKHLMECGFRIIYGFTESDEISLLFHLDDNTFGRKLRKLNSVLASEAGAKFSILVGGVASFDCRISELPTSNLVIDYFRWRNEDAHRNALNAHCYWLLRKQGKDAKYATAFFENESVAFKNEFLFRNGINFNDVPNWQKRGIGLYYQNYEKTAQNEKTKQESVCVRRRIDINYNLPMKDDYDTFLRNILLN